MRLIFILLFSFSCFSQQLIDPAANNILHWWIFDPVNFPGDTTDHGSAGTYTLSRNGTIGDTTVQNSILYRGGYSTKFYTGKSYYYGTLAAPDINTPFSIAIWFNLPGGDPNADMIFMESANGGVANNFYVQFHNSTNKFRWIVYISNSPKTCVSTVNGAALYSAYFDGNWHLMTCVHDGDSLYMYLDGARESSLLATGNMDLDSPNHVIDIGVLFSGAVYSQYYLGYLEEIRVYNVALNADQVSALWNSYQRVQVVSGQFKQYSRWNKFKGF